MTSCWRCCWSRCRAGWVRIKLPCYSTASTLFTLNFLWVVILSTLLGIGLSFTRLRKLKKVGTTDLATLFVYLLIITIGMRLDLSKIGGSGGLFLVAIL